MAKKPKKPEKKTLNKQTSSYIKRRRLDLNLTMSELCDSICSVSYLSKVENNQIVPGERYTHMLLEKLNVSEEEINVLENAEAYIDNIALAFTEEKPIDTIEKFYSKIKECGNNYIADFYKIAYLFLMGEYDECFLVIKELKKIRSTLGIKEVSVFDYLTLKYYLATHDYPKFLKIKNFNPIRNLPTPDLVFLYKELYFEYYSEIGDIVNIYEDYDDLTIQLYRLNQPSRALHLTLCFLKALFIKEEYKKIVQVIDDGKFLELSSNDLFNMIAGLSYYRFHDSYAAIKYLNRIDQSSDYYPYIVETKYDLSFNRQVMLNEIKEANETSKNIFITYFIEEVEKLPTSPINKEEFEKIYNNNEILIRKFLLELLSSAYIKARHYKDALKVYDQIKGLGKITTF